MFDITITQAIKDYCKWCNDNEEDGIKNCRAKNICPLWRYRLGKEIRGDIGYVHLNGEFILEHQTRQEAVTERCLNCIGYQNLRLVNCQYPDCALYPFRKCFA